MENWTNEIWVAIGIAFIVGLFIGYIIVRLTKGSVKHQAKTEAELKTVKTQLDTQKAQIEKHFAESAELFKTLINDYQKLYRHYATSSNNLLGEKEHKGLFTQQLITATDKSQNEQPRDYSEGASGLFKEKKEEIFSQYGKEQKVEDTGSAESQIALFTYRIKHLTEHVKKNHKDFVTTRSLTRLVGKRRALLDYLYKRDIERYRAIIKKLGLRR